MKRTPLRKVNPEYAKELEVFYTKTKPEWLAAHPGCQFRTIHGELHGQSVSLRCGSTGGATVHHMMRRKKYLNDTRFFMTVCPFHHTWIESNKREARKLGYILYK